MPVSAKTDAITVIDTFASDSSTKSVWPNISKADLVAGLKDRVNNPDKMNQAGSPYCGPTSLLRSYCLDDPVGYAMAAIALYTTGTCKIGNLSVAPSDTCKSAKVEMRLNVADWLMMGGLRDSENSVFSTGGILGDSVAGITLPGTLAGWFEKAGYTDITNTASTTGSGSIATVRWLEVWKAGTLQQKGYRVCLFVDSDVLYTSNQEDLTSAWPDHWIVLESAVGPDMVYDRKAGVVMTVFTWGKTRPLAEDPTKPVSEFGFLVKYYGYVAAKPPIAPVGRTTGTIQSAKRTS